jgi:hypothetical protein
MLLSAPCRVYPGNRCLSLIAVGCACHVGSHVHITAVADSQGRSKERRSLGALGQKGSTGTNYGYPFSGKSRASLPPSTEQDTAEGSSCISTSLSPTRMQATKNHQINSKRQQGNTPRKHNKETQQGNTTRKHTKETNQGNTQRKPTKETHQGKKSNQAVETRSRPL